MGSVVREVNVTHREDEWCLNLYLIELIQVSERNA